VEELKTLLELTKIYGLPAGIIVYLLWERRQERLSELDEKDWLEKKKASGEWVSWEDLKNKIDRMQDHIKYLEVKVSDHLEKEMQEDLKINSMEKDIQFQVKEIDRTKGEIQEIFKLLSEIKNMMITKKN